MTGQSVEIVDDSRQGAVNVDARVAWVRAQAE
jgi:hypothetical protein